MPTGYKICPECHHSFPGSWPKCDCGHVFFRHSVVGNFAVNDSPLTSDLCEARIFKTTAGAIRIYSTPGSYKKQCPQCKGYIYNCEQTCDCGYKFK